MEPTELSRYVRDQLGLTQFQLARLLGVSRPTIERLESKKARKPRGFALAALKILAARPAMARYLSAGARAGARA